jgi:hypothetical protein
MLSRAILVKDLIESQKNTIQMSSQSDITGGIASVGDLWYKFVKMPEQHLLLIPFNNIPLMFNFEQSRLE